MLAITDGVLNLKISRVDEPPKALSRIVFSAPDASLAHAGPAVPDPSIGCVQTLPSASKAGPIVRKLHN